MVKRLVQRFVCFIPGIHQYKLRPISLLAYRCTSSVQRRIL
jgi:hypothetical protein